ncbi:MAG: hypothetical protein H0U16_04725 [Actinobacteria bacterium]|nr:hypothetical protein [Actinomycetota bacterium]
MSDFKTIADAVDRIRAATPSEMERAATAFNQAVRDYAGSVKIRWHQVDRPSVTGAGVRQIKTVERDDAGNIDSVKRVLLTFPWVAGQ